MAVTLSPTARVLDTRHGARSTPRFWPEAKATSSDLRNIFFAHEHPQRKGNFHISPICHYLVRPRTSGLHAIYSSPGRDNEGGRSAAVVVAEDESDVSELKQALEDTIYVTDRGLGGNGETRSEIMELVTQLEAFNPNPNPLESFDLMDGKWILRYTSLSEFLPLLWAGSLPLIKVGEISQTISMKGSLMVNSVSFIGSLGTGTFSANASFEVCSPKRLQVKFEEGVVGTPQLTDSLNLPESFSFLGQKVDLTAFQGVFQTLQSATYTIAKTISGQPPFKFPIRSDNARSWLLTTYLDHDLRISRGDNGTVFVFVKEGSFSSD